MKVLKDENNFYKAENIALKKELEELYKKIEERDLAKQKLEQKTNEAGLDRTETIKKQDKTEPERPKLPVSGKTGR